MPSARPPQSGSPRFLQGGGELGELIRGFDWAQTVLGPADGWPQSLKTATSILLESHFGMYVAWGRDYIQIYNDLYRPILGSSKHPAIGRPAHDTFAESWHIIGPLFDQVMRGEAVGADDWMLPLDRHGFLEECFFTFSYSPIRDESGDVGGVLVTVTETTRRVLGERRLLTLRTLAERASASGAEDQAWLGAGEALAANAVDLPFVGVYALEADGRSARRTGPLPAPSLASALPATIALGEDGVWPIERAFAASAPTLVTDVLVRVGEVKGAAWPEPVHCVALVPISRPNLVRPYGVLLAGLSPRLAFNDSYRDFLVLSAGHIATAVGNARAHDDERRRAEALAEIDRAKTTFFSNVSHEFRTPLTLMLSPTEEALGHPERALTGDDLATVYRNQLRLLKLVNTLLEFSRIEAGRAQASYEATDLAALTAGVASAFRSAITKAGLGFDVDCPPLSGLTRVDRGMWETIVLNLLSNALKFTFEGAIQVTLRERDGRAELQVRDTGVGVASRDLPRLFERFHRVRGVRARTEEGSGIGLALVHELVKMHGGTLTVESTPDVGSTFTVSIPTGGVHEDARSGDRAVAGRPAAVPYVEEALRWLPGANRSEAPATAPDLGAPARAPVGPSIVVVDDNADMRDYLMRLLGDRWNVTAYGDGRAAFEAIRACPPVLVITDVMMPGVDGFQLLERVRHDPNTQGVRVLMVSARAGEEARLDGLRAGADDYLVKPFSARELRARVEAQALRAEVRHVEEAHNRRLLSVFRHAPVAIAILRGPQHVFEFVNDPYVELIGPRPVVGKGIREALPELHDQGIYELLDNVYTSGQPFNAESLRLVLNRGPEGEPEQADFKFVYQPMLDDDGAVQGIVVVASEVTELANARRQAESASRAKDDFIAMLSHELRGPLSPMLTALHLMRLKGVEAVERERAVAERQVRHMANLVDDLLDVSRITSGRLELKKERLQVADVVTRAVEMAGPLLESRQHALTVSVPASGLSVEGDAARLAQVVANLLTNAAKFTPSGGHVAVTAARDGELVLMTVQDNGIGIETGLLDKVFEPFAQAGRSLDRGSGGLGLGLSIVRGLVQGHGGSIVAASDGAGRGTTFTVRLPLVSRPEEASEPGRPRSDSRPAAATGVRVLVVDDNEDSAEMLAALVAALGYETRVAHDGPQALALAEAFDPHVALLDIGLPVMHGYELARRLKANPQSRRHLIAVTGYGHAHDRAASTAAGFDAHLVKPVNLEELTALLARFADAPRFDECDR